ncbi:beta-lactamase-like protein [Lasiosphaeria hispida]|uniref:Beta-lactamase-like protein n=1 Tax=Lasiosphaeria hispida TaxID=260671 RepID=A0AAJ0H4S4_9PEZI|nr:beta-lactamase-like protein [Lasiosphaeria hispida]
MASKRKAAAMASAAPEEPVDPADELMFLCLGGGNEVGRSCHVIQYKGKTVMLDAGQHPAYDGLAALPFHIDHAASLPYVLAKTNFRGRVFMTHPTKALYKWLIQDSVRVGNTSSNPTSQLVYTEQDHLNTFPQIEAIDYHTTHTISSIRITPYPAGHDRHLVSAEVPRGVKIDVLITESTYGVASHVPRVEREQALMKSITGILNRGGRVLMPVFALGRAQELLLILDEYWGKALGVPECRKRGSLGFQVYSLAQDIDRFDDVGGCVMLASPGMLQNGVSRELLERWAPSDKNGVIITGYSVEGTMAKQIMQEPDQIQSVMSRNLGGARRAPGGDAEKVMIPRRCTVQEYSFAAHVDGVENREFIEEILVHGEVHNMMRLKSKLLSLNANKTNKVKVYSPRNCEELRISRRQGKWSPRATAHNWSLVQNDFKMSLMAPEDLREYAGLTTTTIACKQRLRLRAAGIDLIKWGLEGTFGSIEEIPEAKPVGTNGKAEEDVEMKTGDEVVASYLVMGCVIVRYRNSGEVELEWEGNMLNDGIADSVMAALLSVESSPAAVKPPGPQPTRETLPEERLERLMMFLEAQFGADNVSPIAEPRLSSLPPLPSSKKDTASKKELTDHSDNDDASMEVSEDEEEEERQLKERQQIELARLHRWESQSGSLHQGREEEATVWPRGSEVECGNRVFADRVRAVAERAVEVTAPLWGG